MSNFDRPLNHYNDTFRNNLDGIDWGMVKKEEPKTVQPAPAVGLTGQVAFWGHDQYPYLRWGTIDAYYYGPELRVTTKEYHSLRFLPKFVLPKAEAGPIIEKLQDLTAERDKALAAIARKFSGALTPVLEELEHFRTKIPE